MACDKCFFFRYVEPKTLVQGGGLTFYDVSLEVYGKTCVHAHLFCIPLMQLFDKKETLASEAHCFTHITYKGIVKKRLGHDNNFDFVNVMCIFSFSLHSICAL